MFSQVSEAIRGDQVDFTDTYRRLLQYVSTPAILSSTWPRFGVGIRTGDSRPFRYQRGITNADNPLSVWVSCFKCVRTEIMAFTCNEQTVKILAIDYIRVPRRRQPLRAVLSQSEVSIY